MRKYLIYILLCSAATAQIINPGGGGGGTPTSAAKVDVMDASSNCAAAGANTTTYTCNLSPAITAYVTGIHYRFKADVANTAASTINFNGVGAVTIKKAAGGITTDVAANDFRAGQWVDLVYDGTNMQMQSTSGNASAGGFTAPTGWSATSGNWTVGTDNLANTSTRTCGAGVTCGLFNTSSTASAVAGSDIRLFQVGGTVTGGATNSGGSTWATTYNQTTYNLTSGTGLNHGLHDIQRATFTSTAGSPLFLGAAGYFTAGMTNLNGAVSDLHVLHAEWDGSLSGTGTFTNGMATVTAGVPGAITGSPTVPYWVGFLSGDPTTAGAPGTVKCGLSVATPSVSGSYGICIPTPSGTYTNSILTGSAPNWFSGGLLTGPLQAFHGSLSTNTKIEVATNNGDAMIGYYNANGGLWEAGIGSGANGEFIIKDTANSVTPLQLIKSTGQVKLGALATFGTASAFGCLEGTAPTNISTYATIHCDSTTHELMVKTNGSATAGMLVRAQPGQISSGSQTAAITTATLCAASAGACNIAGQYAVSWNFIEAGTACGTPGTGGVTFLLTWTDANGSVHSAVSLGMDDASAINAVSQTFHFQTANTAAWGSGHFIIDSNGSIIQYATGYTACGVGTGTYQLRITVTRLQ